MTIVTDTKSTEKIITLIPFLRNCAEKIYLAANHSKMTLVIPRDPHAQPVAVITSQNLSRGNRFESHITTSDPGIVAKMKTEINSIIDLHSIPIHELY